MTVLNAMNVTKFIMVFALATGIIQLDFFSAFALPIKNKKDPVPMIVIPAGEFLMGNKEGVGRKDEWPQQKIFLNEYLIDKFEVTNSQYLKFIKETGHRPPLNPYGEGNLTSAEGIESLPVVRINWYDAVEYCQWNGKRLPTEAEWEKAARGTDGRLFPWGNKPPSPDRVNFNREWDEKNTLRAVGTSSTGQSPYGVEDMAGNAREWVRDWYHPDYYGHIERKNPQGPPKGVLRVIRGGSWHSPITDIRTTARGKGGFALRTHGTGFRCARDVSAH